MLKVIISSDVFELIYYIIGLRLTAERAHSENIFRFAWVSKHSLFLLFLGSPYIVETVEIELTEWSIE
jgi:hypothetical protein